MNDDFNMRLSTKSKFVIINGDAQDEEYIL